MEERENYNVYAKTDENGYIVAVNSSAFLADATGWVEIDSGDGDRYHHAQGNYFSDPLMTEGGAYRYKLHNGAVAECTAEEIATQEAANVSVEQPSALDVIEAQVMYTAMMTDTLLGV